MLDLVTLGESMFLVSPLRGTIETALLLTKQFGGSESNVAVGVARLGHRASWVSSLGEDPFGHYILKSMRGEGVDVSGVVLMKEYRTGVYFKEVLSNQTFRIHYYRENSAASHMSPSLIDKDQINQARYLFITGITPALSESCAETVTQAVFYALESGTKVILDPNIRLKLWSVDHAKAMLLPLLKYVDYFLPGIEECELLSGCQDPETAAAFFIDLGVKNIIIKLGAKGAYYQGHKEKGYVPAFEVAQVADPIGAGDGFNAGLISGLLHGLPLHDAVNRGCAVGAHVVTMLGDIEGLPTKAELEMFLQKSRVVAR